MVKSHIDSVRVVAMSTVDRNGSSVYDSLLFKLSNTTSDFTPDRISCLYRFKIGARMFHIT
jgi:hypothetical protein